LGSAAAPGLRGRPLGREAPACPRPCRDRSFYLLAPRRLPPHALGQPLLQMPPSLELEAPSSPPCSSAAAPSAWPYFWAARRGGIGGAPPAHAEGVG